MTIVAFSCFFRKHLLSCFFEVRATFIVELLFCVSCSSLRLRILQGLLVLVLVRCWRLLHAHHGAGVAALTCVVTHAAHSGVHS